MQQGTERIAILLATYNGEKYLREQLQSLYDQTYTDWTLYIGDDGSTDGTADIVREFSERYGNIVFRQNSEGKGAMRKQEEYTVSEIIRKGWNPAVKVTATMDELLLRVMDQNFVPVTDGRGTFIGIVTRQDIIKYFMKNIH